MATFQAKIDWKRLRNRANKNYRFCYVPTRRVIKNYKTTAKKFKKL